MTAPDLIDLPVFSPDGQYLFTFEELERNPRYLTGTGETWGYTGLELPSPAFAAYFQGPIINVVEQPPLGCRFGILQDDQMCRSIKHVLKVVKDEATIQLVRKDFSNYRPRFRFRSAPR